MEKKNKQKKPFSDTQASHSLQGQQQKHNRALKNRWSFNIKAELIHFKWFWFEMLAKQILHK